MTYFHIVDLKGHIQFSESRLSAPPSSPQGPFLHPPSQVGAELIEGVAPPPLPVSCERRSGGRSGAGGCRGRSVCGANRQGQSAQDGKLGAEQLRGQMDAAGRTFLELADLAEVRLSVFPVRNHVEQNVNSGLLPAAMQPHADVQREEPDGLLTSSQVE